MGHVSIHCSKTGRTRDTGVCCSMNSLTMTAHGRGVGAAPGQLPGVLGEPVEDASGEVLGDVVVGCGMVATRLTRTSDVGGPPVWHTVLTGGAEVTVST